MLAELSGEMFAVRYLYYMVQFVFNFQTKIQTLRFAILVRSTGNGITEKYYSTIILMFICLVCCTVRCAFRNHVSEP